MPRRSSTLRAAPKPEVSAPEPPHQQPQVSVSTSAEVSIVSSMASSNDSMSRRKRFLVCRNPAAASTANTTFLSSLASTSSSSDLQDLGLSASPLRGPQRFLSVNVGPPPTMSDNDPFKKPLPPPPPRPNKTPFTLSSLSKKKRIPSVSVMDSDSMSMEKESVADSVTISPAGSSNIITSDESVNSPYDPFPNESATVARSSSKKSVADKSGSPSNAYHDFKVPPELLEEGDAMRYITNWIPVLHGGKKFIVEGDLLDFTHPENPNHYEDRWKSGKVTGRISKKILVTKKTKYVLEGKLNFAHAQEKNLPFFIVHSFYVSYTKR